MIPAPIPANEADRIASLHRMNLVSSPREADLDRITRVAQKLFVTEISLISLIDHYRQWFKSRIGLAVPETPRDISFCGHAIAADKLFVVSDAARDDRFHDNPLVTGGPNIRFYAGQPIKNSEGFNIGTLCIISPKVRELSDEESEALADLGRMVEIVLEARDLGEAQTALLQELDSVRRDTLIDPMTGLWNRRGYDRLIAAEIAQATRDNESLAVAVVDIDHFKKVNDNFGHQKGDEALTLAADLLKRAQRPHDVVARYGGEEFVVVARGAEFMIGTSIAEKILRIFRHQARIETPAGPYPFTVSVGMAIGSPKSGAGFRADALFEAADKALYAAKNRGRDRYEIAGDVDPAFHGVALA
jgi:diguanylate cyclase (GGDEF)-like protein